MHKAIHTHTIYILMLKWIKRLSPGSVSQTGMPLLQIPLIMIPSALMAILISIQNEIKQLAGSGQDRRYFVGSLV